MSFWDARDCEAKALVLMKAGRTILSVGSVREEEGSGGRGLSRPREARNGDCEKTQSPERKRD